MTIVLDCFMLNCRHGKGFYVILRDANCVSTCFNAERCQTMKNVLTKNESIQDILNFPHRHTPKMYRLQSLLPGVQTRLKWLIRINIDIAQVD